MNRLCTVFLLLFQSQSWGQSLKECENLLIQNNPILKSMGYDIEIAGSAALQAGIRDLPFFESSFNTLNPSERRVFDVGTTGQKTIGISQTIHTAQKKRKERAFYEAGTELTKIQYELALAELKYQLKNYFYNIYFSKIELQIAIEQSVHIDSLLSAYTLQANKGNIPLKDVARLQALSLTLLNRIYELNDFISIQQQEVKLLLQNDTEIEPQVDEKNILDRYLNGWKDDKSMILDSAKQNSPVYLSSLKALNMAELGLQWQKSLASPNLQIGTAYDQQGGAFRNELNLTLSMPLPLWNPNKGNIQIAKAELTKAKIAQQQLIFELQTKINTAIKKFQNLKLKYQATSKISFESMSEVYDSFLRNIKKRNITLLEFTDFAEGYYQSRVLFNQIKLNLILTAEEINLLTYSNIF